MINDLWLKRILRAPTIIAVIIPKMEEAMLICPVIPTGLPNDCPISINKSPNTMLGVPDTKFIRNRVGSTNLPTGS